MSKQDMENAIDRLAALIESGELIAATDPVGFINVTADKIEALTEKADYAEAKLIEADALAFKQVNRVDDLQDELDRMKDRVERADEEVTIVENALEDAKSDIDTLKADNDRLRGALEEIGRTGSVSDASDWYIGDLAHWYRSLAENFASIAHKALQDNPTTPGDGYADNNEALCELDKILTDHRKRQIAATAPKFTDEQVAKMKENRDAPTPMVDKTPKREPITPGEAIARKVSETKCKKENEPTKPSEATGKLISDLQSALDKKGR